MEKRTEQVCGDWQEALVHSEGPALAGYRLLLTLPWEGAGSHR